MTSKRSEPAGKTSGAKQVPSAKRAPVKRKRGATKAPSVTRGGGPAQERELRDQGRKTLQRLLDAGMQVFERSGFHGARVDDVVKAAKTSHGTFYLYFSNKEDLFKALASSAMDEMALLADELEEVTPDAKGLEVLRDWIVRFLDVYAKHGAVIRAWTEGEIVDNDLGRQGTALLTTLTRALGARISEAGTGDDVDSRVAALACLSMLERFSYLVQSRQIDFDRDDIVTTLARVTHAGFFTGQAVPSVRRRRVVRAVTG